MRALVDQNSSQLLLEGGFKLDQAPRRGQRGVKSSVREEEAVGEMGEAVGGVLYCIFLT